MTGCFPLTLAPALIRTLPCRCSPQHDNKAAKSGGFACHARCDEVMRRLAQRLGLQVPRYVRRDAVVVGHQQHSSGGGSSSRLVAGQAAGSRGTAAAAARSKQRTEGAADRERSQSAGAAPAAVKQEEEADGEDDEGSSSGGGSGDGSSSSSSSEGSGGRPAVIPFSVFVQSSHGPKCPMPMVQSVDFAFDVSDSSGSALEAGRRAVACCCGMLLIRTGPHNCSEVLACLVASQAPLL